MGRFPRRYEVAWDAGEGLVLWRPVPPPGYVALGCVATSSPHEPPPLQHQACVRQEALVDARPGQCMVLCALGNLWSVANCGATLVVASHDAHAPAAPQLRDLRLPVGVAPAALTPAPQLLGGAAAAAGAARAVGPEAEAAERARREAAAARALQQRFLRARAEVAHLAAADRLTVTSVEFRRLWWDRNATSATARCQVRGDDTC